MTYNPSSASWQAWCAVVLGCGLFFFQFFQLSSFNVLSNELITLFGFSPTVIGTISGQYFLAAALFAIPAGLIIDRRSPRQVLLICMTLSVIFSWALTLVEHPVSFGIIRFIQGFLHAFCFLVAMKMATLWLPPKQMALATGLIITLGMLGGMAAQTPLTLLVDHFGWKTALHFFTLGGLGLCLLMFIFIRVPAGYQPQQHQASFSLKQALKVTFSNRQNWCAGMYTAFLNLPLIVLGGLWGSQYLMQVYHLSDTSAASIVSMLFLGTLIGSPIMGYCSDRWQRRCRPMIVAALMSTILLIYMLLTPSFSTLALYLAFFGIGLFTSAQIISYPLITESNHDHISAAALSIASVIIMGMPSLFQPLFSGLVEFFGFHTAFASLPIICMIGVLFILPLRETYCKRIVS